MRRKTSPVRCSALLLGTIAWLAADTARAVEIEPMGKAIAALLGTTKAFKRMLNDGKGYVPVFYSRGGDGKPEKVVFIEKGLFEPDCTHTWAIGLDYRSERVTGILPIEMSCQHAFPTKSPSFLDQFTGKGPADAAKLESQVQVVAKATGTCKLAIGAVKRSILTLHQRKAQF